VSLVQFFSAPVGTRGNAVLNWAKEPTADVIAYARSYRTAANRLRRMEEEREFGEIDHDACPILFLFRHSLELYLKAMICRAALISVSEQELPEVLPRLWREHSLLRLLAMAEPVLQTLARSLLPALRFVHEGVLEVVEEMDRLDPGSYTFRYPVTANGSASLPDTNLVNVFVFAERVDEALTHFSDICVMLDRAAPPREQLRLALSPILRSSVDAS
jgi:hypothetical protein